MSTLFGEINTVEDLQKHWRDPYIQWWAAGMPSHDQRDKSPLKQIMLKFRTREDREHFANLMNYKLTDRTDVIWYPNKDREKNSTNRYVQEGMTQDLFEDDGDIDD